MLHKNPPIPKLDLGAAPRKKRREEGRGSGGEKRKGRGGKVSGSTLSTLMLLAASATCVQRQTHTKVKTLYLSVSLRYVLNAVL